MRSAPPVLVPVGRFVWGSWVTIALALVVMLSLAVTWRSGSATPVQALTWLTLLVLACAASWWLMGRDALPAGTLDWDGEGWHYEASDGSAALPVTLQVRLDAGAAMLVGVYAQDRQWRGQRFTCLQASQMPERWHAWRCAVYGQDIL